MAQPDGNGNCIFDALYVTGGASNVPIICGENSGQHIYVNFNGDNDITLRIDTSSAVALARSWNLKIAQIGCACPTKGKCFVPHLFFIPIKISIKYGIINAIDQM